MLITRELWHALDASGNILAISIHTDCQSPCSHITHNLSIYVSIVNIFTGQNFDQHGNRWPWWSSSTHQEYEKLESVLRQFYGAIKFQELQVNV